MIRSLKVDGRTLNYLLERKDVKNINLRVRADQTVCVSAAKNISVERLDGLVLERASFIFKALDGFAKKKLPCEKRYVDGESVEYLGCKLRLKVCLGEKNYVECDGIFIKLLVRDVNCLEMKRKLLNRWLRGEIKRTVGEICNSVYPKFKKFGVEHPKIVLRTMVSRWGSCQKKSNLLVFNTALISAPICCIEYVVMHEFTHLLFPDHSKKFYRQLSTFMPDWERRKFLLENGL